MPLLLYLLLMFITSSFTLPLPSTRKYLSTSGRISFGQTIHTKSITILTIPNPIILYSISTIRIVGYFSYSSSHNLTTLPSTTESQLTITVSVSKVSFFEIVLGYLIIESMPNMQDGVVRLTMQENIIKFKSKKKILRNNDLNVAAHLIGFSSSKIAKENFFYASVFDYNYQIWTSAQLSSVDFLIIHFLIIDVSYQDGETICLGSFVYANSKAHNAMSPYKVQIDNSLQVLLGIQAFNLPNADFSWNNTTREVSMGSTGAYSFSIIAVNTSCELVIAQERYFDGRYEKVYMTVFVVFLVLSGGIVLGFGGVWVWRWWKRRKGMVRRVEGSYNVTVEDRLEGGVSDKRESEKDLVEKRIQSGESMQTGGRIRDSSSGNKVKKKKKTRIISQPQKE